MWTHTNNWESWFEANFPNAERFLYITDEPATLTQAIQWSEWMKANTGVGANLRGMVTTPLPGAQANLPNLNIDTSIFTSGLTTVWENALAAFLAAPLAGGKEFFMYNGERPYQGSFCTDDDGVSLRELPWAQYKLGVSRWFYWQGSYYNDYQSGRGENSVFEIAQTFGSNTGIDPVLGETGWNHTNGEGVLFYPGTDRLFPQDSYGVDGPIVSLRLKYWRRGIQDTDYIALAMKKNPTATQAIINQMVPKAEWEYNATDASDPTWTLTDISWSIDPDVWENARAQLAAIILK